jgi:hypothetical protein
MKEIPNFCPLAILLLLCIACGNKERNLIQTSSPRKLSSNQIFQLVFDTDVQANVDHNFHIFYKEYLNDSTWVISIHQNEILGNEKFGICEVLRSNNNNIFVYGGKYCDTIINDSLKSKNEEWPIQFDGVAFLLLVEIRNEILGYYTLKRRFKFDNDMPDSTDLNLLDLK